ncbi:hypothetical protein ACFQVC_32675 [Streptomyces monticola]|uniref:Uncharacterized protein n=1 Tax=Streptomyces monticola TaxID=2666263 RepID=A0ABW2JUD0_9ACTN
MRIDDIEHRVDPHQQCAEIYGNITVTHGRDKVVFFDRDASHYQEVCESNASINEGAQAGHLVPDAGKSLTGTFSGNKAQDEPFVFTVELWDEDAGSDQRLMKRTVKVWPQRPGVMEQTVADRDGSDSLVSFRYSIDDVEGKLLREQLLESTLGTYVDL